MAIGQNRMLDMGFTEEINEVMSYLPKNRQTLLFSATFPENINTLSQNILNNPKSVEVESTHEGSVIIQDFYKVEDYKKVNAVQKILNHSQASCVVKYIYQMKVFIKK
ncbi:MAG: hypothetical protein GY834_02065 [Bacteroidetes bacterium]|nr:hypothetical protein [Bacteroidota bacterium]